MQKFIFVGLLLYGIKICAQSLIMPDHDYMVHLYGSAETQQQALRPVWSREEKKIGNQKQNIRERLWNNNLWTLKDSVSVFWIKADVDLNLQAGVTINDTGLYRYINGRGIWIRSGIGKKLTLETLFSEYQARPDTDQSAFYRRGTVPGFGRWKAFESNGYDFAAASGVVGIQLNTRWHFSFGQGKHQVGHGYRSLLWSDYMPSYPFAKLQFQAKNNRWRYDALWASMSDYPNKSVHPLTEPLYRRAAASFQLLEWNPHSKISLLAFQSIRSRAVTAQNAPQLNLAFANPLMFYNALNFGLHDSLNNVNLGAMLQVKINSNWIVYAQTLLDQSMLQKDFNVWAYQMGLHYYHRLDQQVLHVQCEYNSMAQGMELEAPRQYGMRWSSLQNPGRETLLRFQWRRSRILLTLSTQAWQAYSSSFLLAPNTTTLSAQLEGGFVLNPERRWIFSGGIKSIHLASAKSNYLYVSLKTFLYNWYNDIR